MPARNSEATWEGDLKSGNDKDGKLGDDAVQINQVFENLKSVLKEAGSSSDRIVSLNIHVKDAPTSDNAITAITRDGILGDPRQRQLPVISELKRNLAMVVDVGNSQRASPSI